MVHEKRPYAANMNPTVPETHIRYDLFITPPPDQYMTYSDLIHGSCCTAQNTRRINKFIAFFSIVHHCEVRCSWCR